MKPLAIDLNRTIIGDCRETMRDLIAQGVRVQMCVTSPPYWGLRDYGVAGQIGLERIVQEYIDSMVEVFGLVRELLADDGSLWLNLGDCYANGGKGGYQSSRVKAEDSLQRTNLASDFAGAPNRQPQAGLKPKDLVMMPARVALALQADGWWVRQDIIWHKPNPMPESVLDRCTKAHEYLFLLSKSERYYFDAEAISEPAIGQNDHDLSGGYCSAPGQPPQSMGRASGNTKPIHGSENDPLKLRTRANLHKVGDVAYARRNRRSVWTVASQPYSEAHFATFPPALIEPCILAGSRVGDIVFDPFIGSGTTGEVAQNLGRRWLGCEVNPEYVKLERKRTAQQAFVIDADPIQA